MNVYEEEIIAKLNELGIEYKIIEHEPMYTMDQYKSIQAKYNICVPKNLFLCNRQKTIFVLLAMIGNKKFKANQLAKQINTARLSFASEDDLSDDLHCFKGCTNIFSLLFDKKNSIRLAIDEDLLKEEYLGFHPCNNCKTVIVSSKDLVEQFLPSINRKEFSIVSLISENAN